MIAHVFGEVARVDGGAVVVDCGGLGYLVQVSAATAARLEAGRAVRLHTIMQVRENDVSLVGFLSPEDAKIYAMLTSVGGVGAKAALAIQSVLDAPKIILAIITGDEEALCRAQGVGKKLAGRIVLELRDRMAKSDDFAAAAAGRQQNVSDANADAKQEALEALVSLGYSRGEALRAVMEVALADMSSEQIIRQCLKNLAR